ncbi:MAG: periplasmic heavy metal sensor, partial [Phenylobacterium sp.]
FGVRGREILAHPRPAPPLWAAAAALPPEHREAYRTLLRAEAQSVAPKLRAARMSRRDAWGRFAAVPFDAAGLAQDLARARALEQDARSQLEARIVTYAATLPPGERASLGEALQRPARAQRPGSPAGRRP